MGFLIEKVKRENISGFRRSYRFTMLESIQILHILMKEAIF